LKKILITGANSYIGNSFDKYMKQWPDKYQVDTIDMIDGSWRNISFKGYDSIYHVAGIAHSYIKNVSEKQKQLYYNVNTKLTLEVANKAKEDGATQFIFMSSSIVYGESAPIGKRKIITKNTPVSPTNFYGDSKVQAENGIKKLNDNSFKVVILRPPMIYGRGSKGNYPKLAQMALKTPIFPYINNERSMLYVGNLMEFVRLMIDNEEFGLFWPQNAEYSNTSEIVKKIAECHQKKVYLIKGFGCILRILSHISGLVNKVFGNMVFDMELSKYKQSYIKFSLDQSIQETESRG